MRRLTSIFLALLLLIPTFALADTINLDTSTATEKELLDAQDAINDALSKLRAANVQAGDEIVISGSGTAIQTGIEIPYSPARVELTTTADIKITLTGGEYEHTYDSESYACEYLDDPATYDILSEGKGEWTLKITPIVDGGTLEWSGKGSAVGNFFALTGPVIVTLEGKAEKKKNLFSNFIVHCVHQYENISSWYTDGLSNEFLSSGDTFSSEYIIKPTEGRTQYFWSVYCEPEVSWTITIKK